VLWWLVCVQLNKAKLTQGAALKRVEKERKALEVAQADTQAKADAASAALEKVLFAVCDAVLPLWLC
jgi:hypothetical protein